MSNIQQAEETILAAAKLLSSNTTALAHTLANARILFSVIGSVEVVRQAEQMTASLQRLSTSSALLDPDELQKVEAQINTLTDSLNADIVAETNRFGKACANPGTVCGIGTDGDSLTHDCSRRVLHGCLAGNIAVDFGLV